MCVQSTGMESSRIARPDTLRGLTFPGPFARLATAAVQLPAGLKAGSRIRGFALTRAEVAELADAHGSGPCTRKGVGVRVPSSAPAICFRSSLQAALRSPDRYR